MPGCHGPRCQQRPPDQSVSSSSVYQGPKHGPKRWPSPLGSAWTSTATGAVDINTDPGYCRTRDPRLALGSSPAWTDLPLSLFLTALTTAPGSKQPSRICQVLTVFISSFPSLSAEPSPSVSPFLHYTFPYCSKTHIPGATRHREGPELADP